MAETADDLQFIPLKVDPRSNDPVTFSESTLPAGYSLSDLTSLNDLARGMIALGTPSNPAIAFPPPPQPVPNLRSQKVQRAKDDGNASFRRQNWSDAIRHYTLMADLASSRPLFESSAVCRDELSIALCNRSAAFLADGQAVEALADAEAVIRLKRPWVKGHFRKGKALEKLGRLHEARDAYLLGLQFDPTAEVGLLRLVALIDVPDQ